MRRNFDIELDDEGTPVLSARRAGDDVCLREPHGRLSIAAGLVVDRRVRPGRLVSVEGDADDDVAASTCARLQRDGGRVVHVPGGAVRRQAVQSRR
jgi:hypothetical protein